MLTGPDGPILYNTRDDSLTYWSMKTNSFSGKKIRSPFNSRMAQGFYHPKLAEVASDTVHVAEKRIQPELLMNGASQGAEGTAHIYFKIQFLSPIFN